MSRLSRLIPYHLSGKTWRLRVLTSAETLVLLQGLPRRRQPFGTIKDIANAKYSQKKNIAKMRDPPKKKKLRCNVLQPYCLIHFFLRMCIYTYDTFIHICSQIGVPSCQRVHGIMVSSGITSVKISMPRAWTKLYIQAHRHTYIYTCTHMHIYKWMYKWIYTKPAWRILYRNEPTHINS